MEETKNFLTMSQQVFAVFTVESNNHEISKFHLQRGDTLGCDYVMVRRTSALLEIESRVVVSFHEVVVHQNLSFLENSQCP